MNDSSDRAGAGVAIFGGAVFDRKYQARARLVPGTSNPVDSSSSHGGVARNIAENLVRLGVPTAFHSIVGADAAGEALVERLRGLGADVGGVVRSSERPTAEYVAVLETDHELALGIADMAIFDLYSEAHLDAVWPRVAQANWILADCNLQTGVLQALARRCEGAGARFAVNTVSGPKAVRLNGLGSAVGLLFTNRDEANTLIGRDIAADPRSAAEALRDCGFAAAVVTDGGNGYAILENGAVSWHQAVEASPVDITGAGDAFVAGTLSRLFAGDGLALAARSGALLAARTTETLESVLPDLSPGFFAGGGRAMPGPAS
ncbi:PfkB family carbohydrate kinase [Mesorhizobium sp. Z1-4]|uniref:PfkB family carbohydrate kinase n=1 Tax=Mesorhizobium sp. Z1-4 TaxID=2448478 RepID=UPI000FDB5F8C|nr:PfkB family carbohydrate kinase [Mesorhizobium sp. Z1-4]